LQIAQATGRVIAAFQQVPEQERVVIAELLDVEASPIHEEINGIVETLLVSHGSGGGEEQRVRRDVTEISNTPPLSTFTEWHCCPPDPQRKRFI
jgi:hypothetical protein